MPATPKIRERFIRSHPRQCASRLAALFVGQSNQRFGTGNSHSPRPVGCVLQSTTRCLSRSNSVRTQGRCGCGFRVHSFRRSILFRIPKEDRPGILIVHGALPVFAAVAPPQWPILRSGKNAGFAADSECQWSFALGRRQTMSARRRASAGASVFSPHVSSVCRAFTAVQIVADR
jgi:hypothetical protein